MLGLTLGVLPTPLGANFALFSLSSRMAQRNFLPARAHCAASFYRNWKSEEFTLANTSAAQKEIRKSARRRQRNRLVKAKTRTVSKKAAQAIDAGDKNAANMVRQAQIELDSAVQKGIIHKNAAARKKSRLTKRLNAATLKS